jgi:hypothetical protein
MVRGCKVFFLSVVLHRLTMAIAVRMRISPNLRKLWRGNFMAEREKISRARDW